MAEVRPGALLQGTATAAYRGEVARSRALDARARRVMPGGNSRHSIALAPYPVFVASGRGCRVTDVEGEERLDFLNNFTSLIHGHADPETTRAVQARVAQGTAFAAPTESAIELAELIATRVPAAERVRFCNSGSEAVMLAVKAARAFTGRPAIAKVEGAYHGLYDYVQVSEGLGPDDAGPDDRPAAIVQAGSSSHIAGDVVVLPWNDADACVRLLEEHRERLAAVILDALPLGLSMIPPASGFLTRIGEAARRLGLLFIGDEVLTFRLGYHGAFDLHGLRPDLLALGKIIGGGFPVGAVAGRADVMDVFDHRRDVYVHHGGTYNANPVTTVAGLATMVQMTPDAYARLDALGDRLRAGLAAMLARRGTPAQVFGRGSLFSVRLTDEPLRNYRELQRHIRSKPIYGRLCHEMLARGIMMSQRGILGCLSTPMTDTDIDAFVSAFDATLEALGPTA